MSQCGVWAYGVCSEVKIAHRQPEQSVYSWYRWSGAGWSQEHQWVRVYHRTLTELYYKSFNWVQTTRLACGLLGFAPSKHQGTHRYVKTCPIMIMRRKNLRNVFQDQLLQWNGQTKSIQMHQVTRTYVHNIDFMRQKNLLLSSIVFNSWTQKASLLRGWFIKLTPLGFGFALNPNKSQGGRRCAVFPLCSAWQWHNPCCHG